MSKTAYHFGNSLSSVHFIVELSRDFSQNCPALVWEIRVYSTISDSRKQNSSSIAFTRKGRAALASGSLGTFRDHLSLVGDAVTALLGSGEEKIYLMLNFEENSSDIFRKNAYDVCAEFAGAFGVGYPRWSDYS